MVQPCVGWCGECYATRTGRQNYPGHSGYRKPRGLPDAEVYKFMKKPVNEKGELVNLAPLYDPAFVDAHPTLTEFMTTGVWDDGSVRETGTMFLFVEGPMWKLMLKDRATGRISFWSAGSLEELFLCVESALAADTVPWKVDRKPAGRGR
jgi:hypothetical protein